MRYAISYVSTASQELTRKDIEELLRNTENRNNQYGITGLLLYSDGNFFQVIEGFEEDVKKLFDIIKHDKRHVNIIKLFETSIHKPSYDGYKSDFVTAETKFDPATINDYRHHLMVLDSGTRKAVENVLRAFIH